MNMLKYSWDVLLFQKCIFTLVCCSTHVMTYNDFLGRSSYFVISLSTQHMDKYYIYVKILKYNNSYSNSIPFVISNYLIRDFSIFWIFMQSNNCVVSFFHVKDRPFLVPTIFVHVSFCTAIETCFVLYICCL